jgi:hypothetical protein
VALIPRAAASWSRSSVSSRRTTCPSPAAAANQALGTETEPNYFRGLREEEAARQNFIVGVQKGKGGSCLEVVQQAIAEKEKAAGRGEGYDEIWCVFDVEQAGQRKQVIEARKLAARHEIRLTPSNPCFEIWLLAHFIRTSRSFADCDRVIEELNKHWGREFKRDYEKNNELLYGTLADRTHTAIGHARRVRTHDWAGSSDSVDCNSATEVHLLVERLLGPND